MKVSNLSPHAFAELARRASLVGVSLSADEDLPQSHQFCPGAAIRFGGVAYNNSCTVETLVHEIAHAAEMEASGVLADFDPARTNGFAPGDDETLFVMPLQVALCGKLEGVGLEVALAEMKNECYGVPYGEVDDDVHLWWEEEGHKRAQSLELPWNWED